MNIKNMNLNGFLLINKPVGPTSHDMIARIRKKLGIKKVGHTGTLDPLAEGLMLMGVGAATKFMQYHVGTDKTYVADITFGIVSDTYDRQGPLKDTGYDGKITMQKLLEEIEAFKGKIKQSPPMYSAIKVGGRKLCDIARKGETIDIPTREVEIFSIDVIKFEYPNLKFEIHCSSGTYIRSIAHDLGKRLGCGAYLSGLIRTKIGDLDINDKLGDNLLSMDIGLEHMRRLEVDEIIIQRLRHGQRVNIADLGQGFQFLADESCRLYSKSGEFSGIVRISGGILRAGKVL